jgi:4-oxalocrotonate tautomerase
MPLVNITLGQSTPPAERKAIAEAVYEAMRESIGIPAGDRFLVVTAYGAEGMYVDPNFMGVNRSDRFILVHIFLSSGRTVAQKQALFAKVASKVYDAVGVSTDDVMTVLTENTLADWSFGKGEAQYVLNPPAWARNSAAGD